MNAPDTAPTVASPSALEVFVTQNAHSPYVAIDTATGEVIYRTTFRFRNRARAHAEKLNQSWGAYRYTARLESGAVPAPVVYEVKDALGWVRAAGLSKQVTENAVEAVQRAYEVAREATPALPPIWTVKTLREVIAKVEADIG
jgi:hypothetical protein